MGVFFSSNSKFHSKFPSPPPPAPAGDPLSSVEPGSVVKSVSPFFQDRGDSNPEPDFLSEDFELASCIAEFLQEAERERTLEAPAKALVEAFRQLRAQSALQPLERLIALSRFLEAIKLYRGAIFQVFGKVEEFIQRVKDEVCSTVRNCFRALTALREAGVSPRPFLDVENFRRMLASLHQCKDPALIPFLFANKPREIPTDLSLLEELDLSKESFNPHDYKRLKERYLCEIFPLPEFDQATMYDGHKKFYLEWCTLKGCQNLVVKQVKESMRAGIHWLSLLHIEALDLDPAYREVSDLIVQDMIDQHLKQGSHEALYALLKHLVLNPKSSGKEKIEKIFQAFLAQKLGQGDAKALLALTSELELFSRCKFIRDQVFEPFVKQLVKECEEVAVLSDQLAKGALRVDEVQERLAQLPFFFSRNKKVVMNPDLTQKKLQQCLIGSVTFWARELSSQRGGETWGEPLLQIFDRLPFSLDLIEGIVNRRGAPICEVERRVIAKSKRNLPDLNKALVGYDLLQRETDRMDLSRFRKEELFIGADRFEAYDTRGAEFRFIVHAAGLDEGPIEKVKRQRMWSGYLCTSLLSQDCSHFYEQESNYGMVLSVDARNIVATTREDAFTPYIAGALPTQAFYHLYQRLQLLTGYIEKLYRESGAAGTHAADEFSRLNHLLSIQRISPDPSLEEDIESLKKFVFGKKKGTNERLCDTYTVAGLALTKVREVLRFFKEHPDKANPEIEGELDQCKYILKSIQSDVTIHHDNIHPLQSPSSLLRQTHFQAPHEYNQQGDEPYNEINLDLKTRYEKDKDPIHVRAILIDRKSFNQKPIKFKAVLENARANGIPILIREDARVLGQAIPPPAPSAGSLGDLEVQAGGLKGKGKPGLSLMPSLLKAPFVLGAGMGAGYDLTNRCQQVGVRP